MKNNIPLVSVIVPNYNYAHYLHERIMSILEQGFTDYEIIFLDDASTDGSINIFNEYIGVLKNARLVVNEYNTGSPFRQWVKGIRLAKGKYVWIAEADDVSDSRFLDTCVKWMETGCDTSFCYVGSRLIDANGVLKCRDVNHWGSRTQYEARLFDGVAFASHNLYWKNYVINASAVLFRREFALMLIDSPFVEMRYCGDWLFWFEMALQGKVVEVYQRLNYFRQHSVKVTAESRRQGGGICEDIQVVRIMEERLSRLPIYKKRLRRGLLYRKINRLHLTEERKHELYNMLFSVLGSSMSDYYLERLNQFLRLFLPRLTTAKRERL